MQAKKKAKRHTKTVVHLDETRRQEYATVECKMKQKIDKMKKDTSLINRKNDTLVIASNTHSSANNTRFDRRIISSE